MTQTLLQGTSLLTSRLGMGTAALHHLSTERARQSLLAAALNAGITHFDTAPMYGEGLAERSLGQFLRGRIRSEVTVGTKVGFPARRFVQSIPALMYLNKAFDLASRRLGMAVQRARRRDLSVNGVEKSVSRSLRSLGVDSLDLLLVHEPTVSESGNLWELADLFDRLKTSGVVKHIGLAGLALSCVRVHQAVPGIFDVLQVEDSVDGREADALTAASLPLQITYGYLRCAAIAATTADLPARVAADVLAAALCRNPNGMILVSSRSAHRITALAGFNSQVSA